MWADLKRDLGIKDAPLSVQIVSFSCSFWHPRLENFGSATGRAGGGANPGMDPFLLKNQYFTKISGLLLTGNIRMRKKDYIQVVLQNLKSEETCFEVEKGN